MKKSIQHYSFCPNVDAIRVVWSESTDPPSGTLLNDLRSSVKTASRKSTHTIKLKIDMHDEDNLNTRFKPLDDLATDGIFSVDDDVVVDCDTLAFAFNVWCSAQESMVGFVPRMHWLQQDVCMFFIESCFGIQSKRTNAAEIPYMVVCVET